MWKRTSKYRLKEVVVTTIERYIRHDAWAAVEGARGEMLFFLRFRTPVLESREVGEYSHRLSVIWEYAIENTADLPDDGESRRMEVFENRLVDAWEREATAVLTAVLTFDGARQWVFYTRDLDECAKLLGEMPQNDEPYPIELTAEEDADLTYLRNQVLSLVSYQDYQAKWQAEFV